MRRKGEQRPKRDPNEPYRVLETLRPEELARFWSRVVPGEKPEDCWTWMGSHFDGSGYPALYVRARDNNVGGHRIMCEIWHSQPMVVAMHSCDNKWCVNPAHLSPGTHADNQRDRAQKRRGAIGERHGCAKLNEGEVREIRALLDHGVSQRQVAQAYGVASSTIAFIAKRQTWAYV